MLSKQKMALALLVLVVACRSRGESDDGAKSHARLVIDGQRSSAFPTGTHLAATGLRYVAYPGTDQHVNIVHSAPPPAGADAQWSAPVVFDDTEVDGDGAVAITTFNGKLFFAFNDTNGHIDIRSSPDGVNWSSQVIENTKTDHAPALAVHGGRLVVGYTGVDNHPNVFSSVDGDFHGDALESDRHTLTESTEHAVTLTSYDNRLFLGWTGEDDSLCWGELTGFGQALTNRVVVNETSDDGIFLLGYGAQLIVSWRGSGNTEINAGFLDLADVNGLIGTSDRKMPNKVTGDRSPYTPTFGNFWPEAALLWTGTDDRVNVKEHQLTRQLVCLDGTVVLVGTDPTTPDTFPDADGDGLPDCWEEQGIDADGDGVADVNLPALGAKKDHKDLFVEIDYFDCNVPGGDCAASDTHNHRPLDESIALVTTAFANGKVNNNPDPNNPNGIALHVQSAEADAIAHRTKCDLAKDCFAPIRNAFFGTAKERTDPNAAAILLAKANAFRYTLWGHSFATIDNPGVGQGGNSDGVHGNTCGQNSMTALGDLSAKPSDERQRAEATDFMHEMGHNLGLDHGGGGPPGHPVVNFKPNYVSVMNYAYGGGIMTFVGDPPIGSVPTSTPYILDYSRAKLPTVSEDTLSELLGIQAHEKVWARYVCPNVRETWGRGDNAIDFNCDGVYANATIPRTDINGDRFCVQGGENGSRPLQTLTTAHDDVFQIPVRGGIRPPIGQTKLTTAIKYPDLYSFYAEPDSGRVLVPHIVPSSDGILHSMANLTAPDIAVGVAIADGPDGICDTTPASGDEAYPYDYGNTRRAVGDKEPALESFDDWGYLSGRLRPMNKCQGIDALLNVQGPLSDTQEDAFLRRTAGTVYGYADLAISPAVTFTTTPTTTTATMIVVVSNHGPGAGVSPTLNVTLPNGITAVSCDGKPCFVDRELVVVPVNGVPAGATQTITIELSIGCSVPPDATLTFQTLVVALSEDVNPADSNVTTNVKMPPRLQDYTLFGVSSVDLGNDVLVQSLAGPMSRIGNGGGYGVTVGNKSKLGDIRSIGQVSLKNNVQALGSIDSSGAITLGNGDVIVGGIHPNTSVQAPSLSVSVSFPSPIRDVAVPAGTAVMLPPGSYGHVNVPPRGELDLSTGTYFFTSLAIDAKSVVALDKSEGPITINVQTAMTMKSSFWDPTNTGAFVLLQYLGTAPLHFDAAFNGTLVAPRASVELMPQAGVCSGIFLAHDLSVKSQAVVTRRAFDPACN